MIAPFAGFLMGFIGSMPVTGPTSLLVFQRGMLARYRDGWAIGLGGGLVGGVYCAIAVHGFSILLALLRRFRGRFPFTVFQRVIRGIGVGLIAISLVSAARMIFTLALHRCSPIHAISNEWLLL